MIQTPLHAVVLVVTQPRWLDAADGLTLASNDFPRGSAWTRALARGFLDAGVDVVRVLTDDDPGGLGAIAPTRDAVAAALREAAVAAQRSGGRVLLALGGRAWNEAGDVHVALGDGALGGRELAEMLARLECPPTTAVCNLRGRVGRAESDASLVVPLRTQDAAGTLDDLRIRGLLDEETGLLIANYVKEEGGGQVGAEENDFLPTGTGADAPEVALFGLLAGEELIGGLELARSSGVVTETWRCVASVPESWTLKRAATVPALVDGAGTATAQPLQQFPICGSAVWRGFAANAVDVPADPPGAPPRWVEVSHAYDALAPYEVRAYLLVAREGGRIRADFSPRNWFAPKPNAPLIVLSGDGRLRFKAVSFTGPRMLYPARP